MNNIINQYTNILQEIQKKAENLSPVLHLIAALIDNAISQNFLDGGRWNGQGTDIFSGGSHKWTALARSTKKQYAKKGYTLEPTLMRTKLLYSSIKARPFGSKSILISANTPYAALHQYGGDITINSHERSAKWKATTSKNGKYNYRFAKSKTKTKNTIERKFKVGSHTIHIPARPYITLTQQDIQDIVDTIKQYI